MLLQTVETLFRHPVFLSIVQTHAQAMLGQYAQFKELMRFIGSHQKWLLTYIIYRRWVFTTQPGNTSKLCMSQICDDAASFDLASRNTVTAFVDGLVTYGFLDKLPGTVDRRFQEFNIPEAVHGGVYLWFLNHGASLDLLDGGNRAGHLQSDPKIVTALQPLISGRLLEDRQWREPPDNVELFYSVKNGFLLLEYLISIINPDVDAIKGYRTGEMNRPNLAKEFSISRSTLYRMLDAARQRGIITWQDETGPSETWLSKAFVDEYCLWQARKFASIHATFAEYEAGKKQL
jgi:hypothetical protein